MYTINATIAIDPKLIIGSVNKIGLVVSAVSGMYIFPTMTWTTTFSASLSVPDFSICFWRKSTVSAEADRFLYYIKIIIELQMSEKVELKF